MDDNINLFIHQIKKRFVAKEGFGPTMDIAEWASYLGLEIVADMVFGEKVGSLEEGRDVNGIIGGVRGMATRWLWVSHILHFAPQ